MKIDLSENSSVPNAANAKPIKIDLSCRDVIFFSLAGAGYAPLSLYTDYHQDAAFSIGQDKWCEF